MNKCIFVGNLTRDPEMGSTNSGISYCRFSIAVNRTYSNANGEREADFINIVTWRGLADNCGKYLQKGSKVCVCGQLQTRTYEGNDGSKRYATEIVADDVEFIGSRAAQSATKPFPLLPLRIAAATRKCPSLNPSRPTKTISRSKKSRGILNYGKENCNRCG